ncbi:hypothetical protein Patl1_27001 [Pistacia atlantica]|uniref:Uncharacterized protein n=1 Tax=Pistacia atlantica TaxID=434234 RepID=A0ACC1B0K2_9ROSI|nr:hypothetical protein Patl1_27001 [Pistacia atlantica]
MVVGFSLLSHFYALFLSGYKIVVGVMRATTIVAMDFSLIIATGLHMPNEVVVWYKRVVGVMRATTIVAMGFSLIIATGLHMPNEVVVCHTRVLSFIFDLVGSLFYGMKMTNFGNQTPNSGCAPVDDRQILSGGSDVYDSPPPSQTSTNNTSFFSTARSLTRVENNVLEGKYTNVLVMGGHIISTIAVVLATNCKSEMRAVGVMRATTIIAMDFNLVAVTGLHMPNDDTRVLSFIFNLVGSLFYGIKMTNFGNQTPNGGGAQVDDRQILSGGSDVYDNPPPSQTSTNNTLFFSTARSLTRVENNVYEGKYTNVLVMGGHIISTTAAILATNCKSEISNTANYLFYFLISFHTRALSFIFDLVGSLFYGMKMTNFRNQTPNGGSAQVDDRQTLSGGSDVYDSLLSSQTSTDNTSFFSTARCLTLVLNNVHEDKYANVLVMGGHIISTTVAVLTTNCKSEMSSRAKYLLYFLISLLVYCPISMLYFSLVNYTRSHTRVLSFIFDLVGSLFYSMKMTNFRNQIPNGGSAKLDDQHTLSRGSKVHDSPPPSQTSTDNNSFFSIARSLTRVVNNAYEEKYANVLLMGGHIISTTAAVLATNCKSEMSSRVK